MVIPLFRVYMARDVHQYVNPVLQSGYIGEGPMSARFEAEFGQFIGNPKVVLVNSGTSALVMALRLAGIGYGDKVISSPMTCLATNMAILSVGAEPVWADILEDGTMDPESVKNVMSEDIKAIMCIDWGGTPCKLDELGDFGVPVIEDACQSLGSRYKNRHIGSAAEYVCFSFQAIKHLTTGDGGAVVVNGADSVIHTARLMRWFGLDRTKSTSMRCDQDPPICGYKYQTNDIASAIGLANIKQLKPIIEMTAKHARQYDAAIACMSRIQIPARDPDRCSGNWLYTVLVDDVAAFIKHMAELGIECGKAHTRNDDKTIFAQWRTELPGVDYFNERHVCIPAGWWLSNADVSNIIDAIKKYDLQ